MDIGAELFRRTAGEVDPHGLRQRLMHLGIRQRLQQRLVELIDDRLRCAGWSDQPVPGGRIETGKAAFGNGRNVRQKAGALERRHRDRPDRLDLDLRQQRRGRRKRHLDVAGDHALQRRTRAAERHMAHLDLGFDLEKFAGQMRRRAIAAGADQGRCCRR